MNLCIVVPCYNEAKRISLNDFEFFFHFSQVNLYFVNDGSLDTTQLILDSLQKKHPQTSENQLKKLRKRQCSEGNANRSEKKTTILLHFWTQTYLLP